MGKKKKLKISLVASEISPLAKTGGLADVAGALPKYLSRDKELEIIALMPFYKEVKKKNLPLSPIVEKSELNWPGKEKIFSLFEYQAEGFKIYLIKNDYYYNRDYLYGTPQGDYEDNAQRFAFFCLASLQAMKLLNFQPDLIHGHDWQAALTFAYCRHLPGSDDFFKKTSSLFTVHNLAYQGIFPKETLEEVGLPAALFNPEDLEFYGKVNFLKAGLLYSEAISTVSPTYSQEIQTPEFGYGLDGVLRKRKERLFGLLNGIDYQEWNPQTDPALPAHYSKENLTGKSVCRKELLAAFNFPGNSRQPVIGMVSRLAGQKGFDLLLDSLDELFKRKINLIILGTGEQKIQDQLLEAKKKYPDRFGLKIAFDDRLARLIYAGSDYFLIPSRYEPCGLTQMYSLRYGTIPIVRSTGGLRDSVQEFQAATLTGNGFLFTDYQPSSLVAAVDRALYFYQQEPFWSKLLVNAFQSDFSWERRATEYKNLYLKILNF
ncbi:MAG: glycogen synthase GlgA [Candidatus Saccharicenans sp.]|nr:MAG: glycogen synthase GlgA [Candidatus Aminicenantes bacterium]HEK84988.1 glycogen synthase GlgA [Candidatus Aminicenantes bacterium]